MEHDTTPERVEGWERQETDVQGYAAPAVAGAIVCINLGVLLGAEVYSRWFQGDPLGPILQQAVEQFERNPL